jgi:hypothetical protein
VDYFEDAVTFLEKEGTVEEITSGDRIYQAHLDLERATAREVFEHINPGTSRRHTLSSFHRSSHDIYKGRRDDLSTMARMTRVRRPRKRRQPGRPDQHRG